MASTVEGRKLTEAHRYAQARLGLGTATQLAALWGMLDPYNLDATAPAWSQTASAVVATGYQVSAALAAEYLAQFAEIEAAAAVTVAPAIVDLAAVERSLLVTGPIHAKKAVADGRVLADAMGMARNGSARAGKRHALGGGWDTILNSSDADPEIRGWARVTSGKTCAFCAMLASRGPVYSDRDKALGRRRHDGCDCSVEPVYSRSAAWPPGSKEHRDLYDRVTRGLTGKDALNAFRRAMAA